MPQPNYDPHAHSGRTGPLDPAMERAHLLARWDEEELTATIPQADLLSAEPLDDDWMADPSPATATRVQF